MNNLLAAYDDKSAYAQTIFSFCAGPGEAVHTFDGRLPGKIVPARGALDFGWDPVRTSCTRSAPERTHDH